MRIFKKILIGIGVVLLIPIGAVVWFFSSGGIFGECETQELVRSKSPSDKYEAMVYTKGCGATTPTATIVALRQDGNASTFEDIFIVEAAGGVGVEWLGPDQLNVTLPKGIADADVFRKEMHWQAVSIEYK